MTIVQQGAINTTAQIVPGLTVQIIPPAVATLNGVPTNILGIVGSAQWGPLNTPTICGSMAQYAQNFGAVQNRAFDLGTPAAIATLQGANNLLCVRVSDGTDAKATEAEPSTDGSFTALYSGSLGNQLTRTFLPGGTSGSWNVQIALPGLPVETFTNITGTGNAFWLNLAAAINNGQGLLRPPSKLVTFAAGAGTGAPTAGTSTFSGGTDGASGVTAATLVGSDTGTRTGMYSLRGQGCSVIVLSDATDTTQWSVQEAFGLAEGAYMMFALPAGTSVSAAVAAVQSAGVPSYAAKIMHGDWLYWYDQANAVYRLVSPASFVAGLLVNLSPQNSSLNKQIYGIVGSQTFGTPGTTHANHYANADLQALMQAGIDVIGNPAPGGNYWAVLGGLNASQNPGQNGDNYTRLTNYLAETLDAGMGIYIGPVITPTQMLNCGATLSNFLNGMWKQGMLGDPNGSRPYSVVCDTTNNTPQRLATGYLQADVAVTYAPIARFLLVNLQGGQTVTVTSSALPQN